MGNEVFIPKKVFFVHFNFCDFVSSVLFLLYVVPVTIRCGHDV